MKITKKLYPKVVNLMQQMYPEYKGKRFFIMSKKTIDANWDANWSGGSRTYYKFLTCKDGIFSIFNPPDFAPWKRPQSMEIQLTDSLICITHVFFCGHDCGITLYYAEHLQLEEQTKLLK